MSGQLTTFEGLVEFRQLVVARDCHSKKEEDIKEFEEKKDVIKYDYQLLDDAYWLLNANGYKIIRNVKLK